MMPETEKERQQTMLLMMMMVTKVIWTLIYWLSLRAKVKAKVMELKVEMPTALQMHKVYRQVPQLARMHFSVMMNLPSHLILMMMNQMLERQMSKKQKITSSLLKISLREDQQQQLQQPRQRGPTQHP